MLISQGDKKCKSTFFPVKLSADLESSNIHHEVSLCRDPDPRHVWLQSGHRGLRGKLGDHPFKIWLKQLAKISFQPCTTDCCRERGSAELHVADRVLWQRGEERGDGAGRPRQPRVPLRPHGHVRRLPGQLWSTG